MNSHQPESSVDTFCLSLRLIISVNLECPSRYVGAGKKYGVNFVEVRLKGTIRGGVWDWLVLGVRLHTGEACKSEGVA